MLRRAALRTWLGRLGYAHFPQASEITIPKDHEGSASSSSTTSRPPGPSKPGSASPLGAPIRTRGMSPPAAGPAGSLTGWTFFRGRPLVWMGMGAGWIVITLGLLMVPIIGGIAANVLQPVFFASFAIAARKQENGETIEMGELFAGFRRPLMPLANLGAIPLLAELAIFALLALLGLPGLTADAEGAVSMADFVREMQGKEWILLVGLVLTAIVKGALWFAPAVLAFHDMNTATRSAGASTPRSPTWARWCSTGSCSPSRWPPPSCPGGSGSWS